MKQRLKFVIQALIGSFTKKINGMYVYALITKTENGLFAVDPEDFAVGRQLRVNGNYGTDEIERLKPHITSNSRVLIVGAHIGTLAIPISKICKDVVAIEANPNTYELLTKNIALNDTSNCHAINIAASSKEESINFLLSRTNSGGSKRVPKNKEYMYYYDNPQEIYVKAFSLDKYLDNNEFDVIVMDIEGSEYFALQGMQEILSKTKLLAVEFLPHHLKNVSGVTVAQFLSVIAPHFSTLTIPSRQKIVGASDFVTCLSEMYDSEQGDESIIFEKI
jgi:FkbM family methyltransferase